MSQMGRFAAGRRGTYGASMPSVAKLRVARPTDNLDALIPFYRDGLGLDLLFRFENHAGFDGIMFGREGAPYHFEFTRAHAMPPVGLRRRTIC